MGSGLIIVFTTMQSIFSNIDNREANAERIKELQKEREELGSVGVRNDEDSERGPLLAGSSNPGSTASPSDPNRINKAGVLEGGEPDGQSHFSNDQPLLSDQSDDDEEDEV